MKYGTNYGIDLQWNDTSNSSTRYGYRLLRSSNDGKTWESKSIWNGFDCVKVLNVHPNIQSENFLKNWMNRIVDTKTNECAGKGLFDIDTVNIDEYNNNLEKYLFNDNNQYRYDVIFFGSYDSNGGKDLSEVSYEATQKFINSGRGILFGHDTICTISTIQDNHPIFARFANQLGIVVTEKGEEPDITDCVDIVNKGLLTCYPWKIEGNLKIPPTHVWGQYSGGSLKSTVWMTLQNKYPLPPEEYAELSQMNAKRNAYLVSYNQLAMIQTGHSNGQASDDECKVIANTLFYLKQFTADNKAKDNSFYDLTIPSKPELEPFINSYNDDSYNVEINLNAKDFGTKYQYCVEAIPLASEENIIKSNIITEEAISGIKGFIVFETDSEDSVKDRLKFDKNNRIVNEVIESDNGNGVYKLENFRDDIKKYIHAFAVDNEGNISDESIYKIDGSKLNKDILINTTITTDKTKYSIGDTAIINVTAITDKYKMCTNGIIEIYDENNNPIAIIEKDWKQIINSKFKTEKSFAYEIKDMNFGEYYVVITWYKDDNIIGSAKTYFKVAIDGKIDDKLNTDKNSYFLKESIKLIDKVYNNSTNFTDKDLEININIFNSDDIKIPVYNLSGVLSTFVQNVNEKYYYINTKSLGVGKYIAVSEIKFDDEILSSDKIQFEIVNYKTENEKINNELSNIENIDSDNSESPINLSVNTDGNNKTIIIILFVSMALSIILCLFSYKKSLNK